MYFTKKAKQDLPQTMSSARFRTYYNVSGCKEHGLKLYRWNLRISGYYLPLMQIYEVTLRNLAVDALKAVYGSSWHNSNSYINRLQNPGRGYNHKNEHNQLLKRYPNHDALVSESNFVYWEKLFRGRFDGNIWNQSLEVVLPNHDSNMSVQSKRAFIHDTTNSTRKIRNRIAHNEPIFATRFDHLKIVNDMSMVIGWRCTETLNFFKNLDKVSGFIAKKP